MKNKKLTNVDSYQKYAKRTLVNAPEVPLTDLEIMTVWNGLGLAGEAGEVCDLLKKGIFHRHGVDVEKLKKELGDVMWYISAICTKYQIQLSDVLQMNVDKLAERYPDGFKSKDSINRKEYTKKEREQKSKKIKNDTCNVCGESITLSKQYGCLAGLEDCKHDKKVKKQLEKMMRK
jgi:NTP pyrophosphatase (non-canonical NTP hydrolase)